MPNWCSNYLEISGKKETLLKFKNKASGKGKGLSFNNFVPIPNESTINKSRKAWGTKWDASDVYVSMNNTLNYSFSTAWSPPIQFLISVSTLYPHLKFKMSSEEPGCEIYFEIIIEDGFIKENYLSEEEYKVKYDENYSYYLNDIKQCSYKKIIKSLIQNEEDNGENYHLLEVHALNRVKNKDLPLFIGRDWLNGDSKKIFEKRIGEHKRT